MAPDIKNLESAYDRLTLELSLIEEILSNAPPADKRGDVLSRWLELIGTFLIADFGQIWTYLATETPPFKCLPGACFGKDEAPLLREASLAARYDTIKSLPGEALQKGQVTYATALRERSDLPRFEIFKSCQVDSAVLLPVNQPANSPSYVLEFFYKRPDAVEPFKIETLRKLSGILARLLTAAGSSEEQLFSDSEYRILLDAVPAMVWYKDRHNRILACNGHAAEVTGLTVEQIVGRQTEEIYPRDAAKYYQDDLEVIKSGKPKRRIVEELRGKNGERFWVSTDKVPYIKNGKVEGIIVFATDVSELKYAEEELLKIKYELESKVEEHTLELAGANVFFTLSRELLCIADTKGYFTRLNPVWSERLGYSLEELCSRPYLEFVHEDDRSKTFEIAAKLGEAGHVRDFENRYVTRDGQVRWLRWSATVFGDSIYAVAYDITDRKNAEQELIEINARFRQISKHMPGMIYQFLVETNGNMSFPYVSEGCKDLLGHEAHEIQADSSLAFGSVYPDDLPTLHSAIKTSCDTMSVFQFEGRFSTPDGVRYMRASSSPERLANGDILFNGLLMDISDLKVAQEEIKKLNFDLEERFRSLTIVNKELENMAQKLEQAYEKALEASKLKSEFVANISHELRTPLSAVIGMCDLLLETSLNAEQTDYATTTRDSARALLTIINDILDFSKIEADKIELEMIDFELHTIVESSVELFLREVAFKKLSLVTHIEPLLPRLVSGDPVRIRQILINLVSNAVKFTDQGEIVVRVMPSNRDGTTSGSWHDGRGNELEYVRFEVSDTGVGIPVSVRQRLFTPFVQADGSTTRKYGGTGLGLSICKRLVDLMQGEIGLVSTQGQGSSFWFTLRLPPSQGVVEIKSSELPLKDELAVYLVGGSESMKTLVTSYLEAERLQVRTATSIGGMLYGLDNTAGEGLTVRAVLIDAGRLSIDPLNIVDAVRRDSRFKKINLIFMVDGHQRDLAELAYERGADLCLFKPIRRMDLLSAALWKRKDSGSLTDSQEVAVQRSLSRLKASEPLRILVVEDNSLMRNLTVKQLEKFGICADVAANGAEAVEKTFTNDYSLLLMDCQMPVMDGFEATLEIRKRESVKGGHVPIIAMTAYAMAGDREQCIACGMDDYLSKPVTMEQLERMLEKWSQDVSPPNLQIAGSTSRNEKGKLTTPALRRGSQPDPDDFGVADAPIDIRLVTEHYGDGSLHEILASFAEELQELVPAIAIEVKRGDNDTVAKLAHQLKGLVSVLSANEISETAMRLEQACRNGRTIEIEAQAEKLVNSKDELISFINNFLLSE